MMYGDDIDRAFQSVISVPQDQLTYDLMEQILLELIEHIPIVSRRVCYRAMGHVMYLICHK